MVEAPWVQKVEFKRDRKISAADLTFPFLFLLSLLHLSVFFFFVFVVMGSFEEGERTQSVSQGEGAVIPAPRIRSFPQPQVTWFRDGRKIPPSSRM